MKTLFVPTAKRILVPHSLADWEFPVADRFQLITYTYVSEPSSIGRWWPMGAPTFSTFFLGTDLGACIPNGQIDWWWWRHLDTFHQLDVMFRVQALDGENVPPNCYQLHLFNQQITITRRSVAQGDLEFYNHNLVDPLALHTWEGLRLTFYHWLDADLTYTFRCIVSRYIAGAWKEQDREQDALDCFADSEANRLGFRLATNDDPVIPNFLMDDTTIYEAG